MGFIVAFSISVLDFKHFLTSPNLSQLLLTKKVEKRSIFYSAILFLIPHLLKYHIVDGRVNWDILGEEGMMHLENCISAVSNLSFQWCHTRWSKSLYFMDIC